MPDENKQQDKPKIVTIAEMQKDIHYIKKQLSDLNDKLGDFIDESREAREEIKEERKEMKKQLRSEMEEGYAPKWVEKAVAGLIVMMLGAVIAKLLGVIGL